MNRTAVIAAVTLVGVALTGYGAHFFVDSGGCSTYYLSVSGDASGYADAPTTDFENLTDDQKAGFRKALNAGDEVAVSELHFERPTWVRYRGDSYLVLGMVSDGCSPLLHDVVRTTPLAVGLLLLASAGIWRYRG
ncbi:hypothetical protein M0R88_13295 [Halorussus gelatinilyticus]|uniref:DUF7979 domain-containing protein n=1 Tax=Halorussus gelatinilyticus TaxID=2937524 RepID=A0A8U0IFM0_9EURY|nr:hypothetical protein [Halorussus gelatinilyticus]UPV99490.1 hypothetical protein M0R88_13295 [Halorussus gelatinilyticus]